MTTESRTPQEVQEIHNIEALVAPVREALGIDLSDKQGQILHAQGVAAVREARKVAADQLALSQIELDLRHMQIEGLDFREPVIELDDLVADRAAVDPDHPNFDWRGARTDNEKFERKTEAWRQRPEAIHETERVIDRQWVECTALIMTKMENPQVRSVLRSFIEAELGEKLPEQLLFAVAEVDDEIATWLNENGTELLNLLKLDAVPDASIGGDIRKKRQLFTRENAIETLMLWKEGANYVDDDLKEYEEERYSRMLQGIRQSLTEGSLGMTDLEAGLVLWRYRFARDAKLLSLKAELHEQPFEGKAQADGTIAEVRQSGLKIVADQAAPQHLLDPEEWQSRRMIKDRVHLVEAGGQKFIMKEHKSGRHQNTFFEGLKPVSSEAEFSAIRGLLNDVPSVAGANARWEKPLGYVVFPDGFQFTLFEYDESVATSGHSIHYGSSMNRAQMELKNKIVDAEGQYEEEYQQTLERAGELLKDGSKAFGKAIHADMPSERGKSPEEILSGIDFHRFAGLKASLDLARARGLYLIHMDRSGYKDHDGLSIAYGATEEFPFKAEAIGFDLEFIDSKDPSDARSFEERWEEYQKQLLERYNDSPVTKALAIAILENDGIKTVGTQDDTSIS